MIRNWHNQIPHPALITKREITKYINWQQFTKGHFHFKLEKKFPQGAKKKYPCIEIIYDFFCHKYSKLHGENVGIDLNLDL